MENYIKKVICTLIAITTILVSSVTYIDTVKADEEPIAYAFKYDDNPVSIYSNANITFYANEGYTIVLNQDIEISEPFYVQGTLYSDFAWTIKMNGHKIYRSLNSGVNNGEIFHIRANQTLNLLGVGDSRIEGSSDSVQNREFTYQGYRPDDSTSSDTKSEMTVTTGGLITGGYSTNTAGAIYLQQGATLNLSNVAVNGNTSLANYSGPIYTEGSNCTINMDNAHVDHNYSGDDGGGIYTAENSSTTINMKESTIDYNITKHYGGGIAAYGKIIINGDISNYNSSVSHNYAGGYAGGIYIRNSSTNSEIRRIHVDNNFSGNAGGGIFITGENTKLADVTIKNNECTAYGAGVFVDADGTVFIDCKITGNQSLKDSSGKHSYAGGIYVYTRYDITMNGRCVVENNFNSEGKTDNVYLNDAFIFAHAYIKGTTLEGARIGLNCDSSGSQLLGINIYDYIDGRYFMDNPESLHVYYKPHEHELYQESGASRKYTLTVNGVEIGDYYQGKQVTISDNNQDTSKIFLNWDTTHAKGLDYIDVAKDEPVFTITMPGNDITIDANYLDCLTSLKLTINSNTPTAGSYLPDSIKYTYGPDEQSRWSWDLEWLEVSGEKMTPTSGRAKYDTTYAFKFQLAKDIDKGLVFSDSIQPENITIKFDDGKEIIASSVSVDEAGTLTIISDYLKTNPELITVESFESTSITVQEGISKDDLINALPSTAIGVDTESNEDIYTVDKTKITDELLARLIDSEGNVIKPESGSATIEIPTSMIDKPENVTFTEGITFSVTVQVIEKITVETPTVTKDSGEYSGTSLKIEASTTTEDATIYYTIDGGDTQTYDSNVGIVLTTEANTEKIFDVNVWAEKEDVSSGVLKLNYKLTGITSSTVTINCRDTSIEKTWSDSVTNSYDTGNKVTVYAPTYEGRVFEKWIYTDGTETKESTNLYYTFNELTKDETLEAIYNPVITTISFNIPYPQGGEALATKDDISVTATIAGVTMDFSGYFDLDNLTWLPNAVVADYETSYTAKLPILHNTQGSKFKVADKLVVMVNGNTDKRLIVNLDKSRENAYVTFPETDVQPYVPTPTPTATSESKKESGGWDDGGPFTTDSCGNVYDRWGNIIYEANGCNVGGYNLVNTETKN